jgi:hypothetical protein
MREYRLGIGDTTMDLVPDTHYECCSRWRQRYHRKSDQHHLDEQRWLQPKHHHRTFIRWLAFTYPTIIASNFPNFGYLYRGWFPNTPPARLAYRVREYDFVDPIGISVSNFNIVATPTAAEVSIAGRVTTRDGRGIYRAMITVVDAQGHSRIALSNAFG